MPLDFDLKAVKLVEFGVGRDDGPRRSFYFVPADAKVQIALREMTIATWTKIAGADDAGEYSPAEKYDSVEYVHLPAKSTFSAALYELHAANNLEVNSKALSDSQQMFAYFARLVDAEGRRVTAVRRSTQFKGIVKNRLLRLDTDTVKLLEDHVFKLDMDFDLLIDSGTIHILRPSGFEFTCKLQDAVMASAGENIASIEADLSFVDFTNIEQYAGDHPRAARYLASIRSQTKNLDRDALLKHCRMTGVKVSERGGRLVVEAGHELAFLEVLDRRRFEIELVKDEPETYRAASRTKVN